MSVATGFALETPVEGKGAERLTKASSGHSANGVSLGHFTKGNGHLLHAWALYQALQG